MAIQQQQPVIPAAYSTDALDLARSQRLAQLLSNQQMPEGQMISGRFVAPSWTQQLAGLVNAGTGAYYANKAEKQNQALAEKLRTGETQALADFMKTKQGTPAEMFAAQAGPTPDGGNIPIQQARAAVAPNPQAAYANLYQDPRSPQRLRDFAFNKMMADPEEITMTEGSVRLVKNPDGTYKQVAVGPNKNPDKIQTAAILLGLDNKPRSEWTKQDRDAIDNKIQQVLQAGAINLGQKGLDNTLKLRSDFRSEPVYKDFQAIDGAYRQINKSLDAGTAAGDLAASTKLMKLLDPTSVVRESELAMAMQATGKLDQLYNYANKIATGQFLSPKQKGEFRTLATEFYNSAGEQYNMKRGEYAGIAERNQINVPDVVGPEVKLKPQIIKTPEGKNKPAKAEKVSPAPTGIPQKTWDAMTPQERSLWQ
jgi:hypothetical protein